MSNAAKTLTKDERATLDGAMRTMMVNTFDDIDRDGIVVEIIDGEAAFPHVWVCNAWISQEDRDECSTEPNFTIKGSPP